MSKKWQTVLLLALAELLAMGLWFSASAVTPALSKAWNLTASDAAWLTMAVQIGFVVGAFLSVLFNVADVWRPRVVPLQGGFDKRILDKKAESIYQNRFEQVVVFAMGTLLGAAANAAIAAFDGGFSFALAMRFVTGFSLAAVYPVGMKIMATWMKEDRGLGLGLLVGALTVGSASPHLIRAFGGIDEWQPVLYIASALAFVGGLIGWYFGNLGPYRAAPAPFRWRYIGEVLADRGVRLANFGYLGHMWELYAITQNWRFVSG